MAFNIAMAVETAALAFAQTAALVPQIGSEDHQTAANQALQAAGQVASQVITDPTQQAEASAAYALATTVLNLVFAFTKKKTS